MTLNPWRRQEPLDDAELARLLPAPGDPALPHDRQLLIEEQLMREIQQGTPQPPRQRPAPLGDAWSTLPSPSRLSLWPVAPSPPPPCWATRPPRCTTWFAATAWANRPTTYTSTRIPRRCRSQARLYQTAAPGSALRWIPAPCSGRSA